MPLNESKGNMYDFVTHTWNAIKGKCYHDCSYCYMKKWGNLKPVRFDEKELKTDMGKDNFIFVGSSCDMFSKHIPVKWILDILKHCENFNNKYLFQTKDPSGLILFKESLPIRSVICTTLESNRYYPDIMCNSPEPEDRIIAMDMFEELDKYITVEPIIDFDLLCMVELIEQCNPVQVNIGADSGNNNLPEPPKEKILELISELEKFTKVNQKKNLKRLLV